MGYAPVTLIKTPPADPVAGTSLTVLDDTGDRYPATPFTGLVFPLQTIPTIGVNAEEVTVTEVEGDTLTIVRGDSPIAITSGLQLWATRTQTNYDNGATVTLSQDFPDTDTTVYLMLRTPQGEVGRYGTALSSVDGEGVTTYSFEFVVNESGQWYYGWASDQRVEPEQDFYVRFSEVL